MASNLNSKVLKDIKYIDKIIIINSKRKSFINEITQLRKTKYDFFINFSPTLKSYFLCFFSKADKKAALIFLSRYKKNFFSKLFIRFLVKLFCNFYYIVNRFDRLKNDQELHQTKMMFNLIKECKIKHETNVGIDMFLPPKKITNSKNKFIVIHLSTDLSVLY